MMIRVIYTDKSVGVVNDSDLGNLIEMGKIAAYCHCTGWVSISFNTGTAFASYQCLSHLPTTS